MAELKKLQENGTDIYPVTLEDIVFDSDGNALPDKYQTKEDNILNTTDKTITGAINELKNEVLSLQEELNGQRLRGIEIANSLLEKL